MTTILDHQTATSKVFSAAYTKKKKKFHIMNFFNGLLTAGRIKAGEVAAT